MENITLESLGLHISHIGINATKENAREIATDFAELFAGPLTETPLGYFGSPLVEVMAGTGRGTYGHIGVGVNDIEKAIRYFEEKGYTFNESSKAYFEDGTLKLIYFDREFAGFTVHLVEEPKKQQ